MRHSRTYTTRSIVNGRQVIERHKLALRRGRALIDARTIFGVASHVQVRGADLVILDGVGGSLLGYGRTWDAALRDADKNRREKQVATK